MEQIQTLLVEFSCLLQLTSEPIADDGRTDAREASTIRSQLQRLQGRGETFVRACERGRFDPER